MLSLSKIHINSTFKVASLFDCGSAKEAVSLADPMRRQSLYGCRVLLLLQEMYGFGMTYKLPPKLANGTEDKSVYFHHRPYLNSAIDLYSSPTILRRCEFDYVYPVQQIFTWRYGFLVLRKDYGLYNSFYSAPFTRPVWNVVYSLMLLASLVFYLTRRWERRLTGGHDECSYASEALVAVSASCQQGVPVQPILYSRRTAYAVHFCCAYVLFCFYQSNLLSHLVSDRNNDLAGLGEGDYNFEVHDSMKAFIESSVHERNTSNSIFSKFENNQVVNTTFGLQQLKGGTTALLSDYVTLYPIIKKTFNEDEICQIIEVDMLANEKKYLITSRSFPYKEVFRIGTLRAHETGILSRLVNRGSPFSLACSKTSQVQTQLEHILKPIIILSCASVLSFIILIVEIVIDKRRRLPFVL